jgi:hypothetical protein
MYPPNQGRILGPSTVPSRRVIAGAVAIGLLLPAVIVLALAGGSLFRSAGGGGGGELGLKVTDSGQGAWVIDITRGSVRDNQASLRITDPSAGRVVYNASFLSLDSMSAIFRDDNDNGLLDDGDKIYLNQNGLVQAGMKVQVLRGDTVMGFVNKLPEPQNTSNTRVGLRAEKTLSGDWLIYIVTSSGPIPVKDVTIKIINASTGAVVYKSRIDQITTVVGAFDDSNDNSKLDAGDLILIRDIDAIDSGMKVELVKASYIVGAIPALPA